MQDEKIKPQDCTDEKVVQILKDYHSQQKDFENHPLWKELGVSPQQFFKKVDDYIKSSGIDQRVWQQKLKEAKRVIDTRAKEQVGDYQKIQFNQKRGIRL